MAYKDLIANMTKELSLFQKHGGNIYAPKQELPYYQRLRSAARTYQREFGTRIPYEQVYADCGIKFDRDYYHFTEFVKNLSKVADKNGFVDSIKSKNCSPDETELKSYLNFHAKEAGVAPGEYLILMTDYRYQSLTISGDYVSYLQEKFNKAYPDGMVKNLKADNPNLYWALKHFQKYAPVELSYNESLAFFGMHNASKHQPIPTQQPKFTEEIALEKLTELYPDRKVDDIFSDQPKLYYNIVKLAVKNDQTVSQWFNSHGLNYTQGNTVSRLSKFQVDANEHEEKLLAMKEEYLKDYDLENADPIDLFRINLEITKRIGQELYGEKFEEETAEESSPIQTTEAISQNGTDTPIIADIKQHIDLATANINQSDIEQ